MPENAKKLRVAVIIPVINESASIANAIDRANQAGADEVIVVDGGSSDATCQITQQAACRLVESAPGCAMQQNIGAAKSEADVLLFMHADNWLANAAIEQIREACQNPKIAVGAFRQKIESPDRLYRWLERGNDFRAGRLKVPYGDQGIFIRRCLFEQIGGFPNVSLMEELALLKKLRSLARPILLPGPIHVSARRWQRHGVVRQTARNWLLLLGYQLGISPKKLAKYYPRHQ